MKRTFLTLGLIAFLSLSAASCSTDDSSLDGKSADDRTSTGIVDNGDRDLPKLPQHP